ncbi:MAG: DUF438 domain-containing protein [Clostridiales bacterium]|nr:DUF438 domain-containing protein [Clostridiales bacterium]
MRITRETKLHGLLETYPFLLEYLAGLKPEFAKLKNPVLRNTVARVATLSAVAEMGGMSVDDLIESISSQITLHAIHEEDAASAATPLDEASRARRQEALKEIIRKLHDGASVDEVKAEFEALTAEIDAVEIAAMEQALIAEGMPVEEVQRLCDVHVSVFRAALESSQSEEDLAVAPGHPVDTYRRENAAAGEIVAELRCAVEELGPSLAEDPEAALGALESGLTRLLDGLATHYARKENQLFPMLEHHGIEGPTKVMWALDDDIRSRIKTDLAAVRAGDTGALANSLPETLGMVEDMIYKEEKILFPTALAALNEAEWEAMATGEAEIGFAWIEPPVNAAHPGAGVAAHSGTAGAAALPLTTGALTLEQIDLMVRALPFDVTYVDEHDRVRFYSEGDRVFPRSPAVIGREVKNCHPPGSVAVVERILDDFKTGSKDLAEFWIELNGVFIHIRYYALRDLDGTYRGCLEVVQDATCVRSLKGEKRLLDW